jgi:hypothetical protein
MSYTTSTRTNQLQNSDDFKLSENQPNIFKKGYFIKELDKPQEDKNKPRTVTVTCTQKGCK